MTPVRYWIRISNNSESPTVMVEAASFKLLSEVNAEVQSVRAQRAKHKLSCR